MNKFSLILILLILLVACQGEKAKESKENNSSKNQIVITSKSKDVITTEEIKNGFVALFDGKTKNGWHVYNKQWTT